MVLRIWRTGIDESRADEYREFARRNSVPMFSSQPGFLGVLFTAAPRQRAVVTLWDSREDLEAYEKGATYQGFLDRVKDFYVGEYWIKHFDVRLGETFGR